jgi:hypothetical protein
MKNLSAAFQNYTRSFGQQIVFVLLAFTFYRIVGSTAFYYGFLQSYAKLNSIFFSSPPSFLSGVPFYSGSILFSSLLHPYFLLTLLLFYLPFFLNREDLTEKLSYNPITRIIVFTSAFILVWELCTCNYNFYLNSAFYLDRVVLIVLAFALLRFPVLTPLFVAFAYVYRAQFNFPVDGFELFDKRLLFDILMMYTVFMYAKLVVEELKVHFIFFVLCIVASNYFMSGVEKIIMSPHGYEWLIYNDQVDLFNNVHLRGWLAKAGKGTIAGISNFVEHGGTIFQTLVLVLELSALFLLRWRKLAIALLISFALMHLGIFAFGSMLFWKWISIDVLLALILIRNTKILDDNIFTRSYFIASLFIILSSMFWLRPIMIGWHDTPFNQYFTYEVEDATGKVYDLDKNGMDPYHQWFQYDRFLFLVNKPVLPISGFGYTGKYKVAKKIKEVGKEGYLDLEAQFGKNNFDYAQKQKYENFIKVYFKNRNGRLLQFFFLNKLAAPHHLYSSVSGNEYLDQAPVKKFRVIFNQVYTQDHKPVILNKEVVDEIAID